MNRTETSGSSRQRPVTRPLKSEASKLEGLETQNSELKLKTQCTDTNRTFGVVWTQDFRDFSDFRSSETTSKHAQKLRSVLRLTIRTQNDLSEIVLELSTSPSERLTVYVAQIFIS